MSENNPVAKKKLNIAELKVKISTIQDKIKEFAKDNKTDVEMEMYFLNNEPEFYAEYPYLIKKLVKGGSLEFLNVMLSNLEKVESGDQSLASTELKLGEELAQQYLYPKVDNH